MLKLTYFGNIFSVHVCEPVMPSLFVSIELNISEFSLRLLVIILFHELTDFQIILSKKS